VPTGLNYAVIEVTPVFSPHHFDAPYPIILTGLRLWEVPQSIVGRGTKEILTIINMFNFLKYQNPKTNTII